MTHYDDLHYVAFPTPEKLPVLQQRKNLVKYLRGQKSLAFGEPNMGSFTPKWVVDPAGSCVIPLIVGRRRLELRPGLDAIYVGSIDRLPAVIELLIAKAERGEFDDVLPPARKRRRAQSTTDQ